MMNNKKTLGYIAAAVFTLAAIERVYIIIAYGFDIWHALAGIGLLLIAASCFVSMPLLAIIGSVVFGIAGISPIWWPRLLIYLYTSRFHRLFHGIFMIVYSMLLILMSNRKKQAHLIGIAAAIVAVIYPFTTNRLFCRR